MDPFRSVDQLLAALARGAATNDEPDIDVLSHSLQCAAILAREHPDDIELIAAGLVHDVADAVFPDHDAHERRGADLVAPLLGHRVAKLVGAHVLAKRYLVSGATTYRETLSERSAVTLGIQGDALDARERAQLERDPDFAAIITLRRADDRAKDPHADVAGLESWRAVLERARP